MQNCTAIVNMHTIGAMRPSMKRAFILLFCASSTCLAGSVDCRVARSFAERLVCTDASFARMDETMVNALFRAFMRSPAPQSVKETQRHWMAVRDACDSRKCVSDAYLARMAELDPSPEPAKHPHGTPVR
jgi:uncharacterized protein